MQGSGSRRLKVPFIKQELLLVRGITDRGWTDLKNGRVSPNLAGPAPWSHASPQLGQAHRARN